MNPDLFREPESLFTRWGKLFAALLLCIFLLFLANCGGEIQNDFYDNLLDTVDPPKTDLEKCYGAYVGWRAPMLVSYKIKDLVCQYYLAHPWRTYIHHSGWRPPQILDWEELETYHGDGRMEGKSFHYDGRAQDHRGVDYSSMTKCQKYLAYRDFIEEIELWRIESKTECMGFGIYVTTPNPFVHEDEVGLAAGEKCGRRWGRIHGKYVAIQLAKDWLNEKIVSCYNKGLLK